MFLERDLLKKWSNTRRASSNTPQTRGTTESETSLELRRMDFILKHSWTRQQNHNGQNSQNMQMQTDTQGNETWRSLNN